LLLVAGPVFIVPLLLLVVPSSLLLLDLPSSLVLLVLPLPLN
jgi:hypothetical protein